MYMFWVFFCWQRQSMQFDRVRGQKIQSKTANYWKLVTPLDSGELLIHTISELASHLRIHNKLCPCQEYFSSDLATKPRQSIQRVRLVKGSTSCSCSSPHLYRLWGEVFWSELKTRQLNPSSQNGLEKLIWFPENCTVSQQAPLCCFHCVYHAITNEKANPCECRICHYAY